MNGLNLKTSRVLIFLILAVSINLNILPEVAWSASKQNPQTTTNGHLPVASFTLRDLNVQTFIHKTTKTLLPAKHRHHADLVAFNILKVSERYQFDPMLIMAIAKNESRFNPHAVGQFGEIGLMQIKPSTALWLIQNGVVQFPELSLETLETVRKALRDPKINLEIAAAYLAILKQEHQGKGYRFLTAYNMGTSSLKSNLKKGRLPTRYSSRILSTYVAFKSESVGFGPLASRHIASVDQAFGLK